MIARSQTKTLSGLYVILDPSIRADRPLVEVLKAAAEGGARIFQYRNKKGSMKEAYVAALPLRQLAADLGATFIINDRCDLALAVEADGVHLGQDDLPVGDARTIMGSKKLIGLSTHNPDQIQEAERLKPDYLGFGPVFQPASKQDHDPIVGLEGLRQVRSLTSLPIFAIGGIQPDRVDAVMQAGADGVAVISAVLNAPDVKTAVEQLIAQLA